MFNPPELGTCEQSHWQHEWLYKSRGHADLVRDTNLVQSLIVIVMRMRLRNEELQNTETKR